MTLLLVWGVAAANPAPLLVDVTVNHIHRGVTILLSDALDGYLVSVDDLEGWGIRGPHPRSAEFNGRPYSRLSALGEIKIDYDPASASIALEFPASLLANASTHSLRADSPTPASGTGFFFDYDMSVGAGQQQRVSGLFGPTLFAPVGTLQTQVLYRGGPTEVAAALGESNWVRLDTTFVRDNPERMRSLRAGDVMSAPGPLVGAVRLGGVQVASNFATRPRFVTFPVPILFGETALPSTLDLMVNGRLRYREEIAPGSFQIDNVPVVNGAGEMQLVVTDVLGRRRVFTQEFYASSELLRPGLHEYSYSLGGIRRNFGFRSNDYGEKAFLASHRYGVSTALTVGGSAAVTREISQFSATADWSPGGRGVLSTAVGGSDSVVGSGMAWNIGYQYLSPLLRLKTQIMGTSPAFRMVEDGSYPWVNPRRQLMLSADWAGLKRGSMGITLIDLSYHDETRRRIVSLNYSRTFLRKVAVSAFVSRTAETSGDVSVGVTISRPLGGRRSLSAYAVRDSNDSRLRTEFQRNLPFGPGFGYRIGTVMGEENTYDANLAAQTDFGRYRLEGGNVGGESIWTASAAGSIAWLAGRPYFARQISDGFAVAKVGDFENVRVYVDNQEVGRSDAEGRVLLPRLRPYETNRVSIEPLDLPLAAELPFTNVEIAPAFRSGLTIEFPVDVTRSALARAVSPDGHPLPEGAAVHVAGQSEPSMIGIDGMLFVKSSAAAVNAIVEHDAMRCRLELQMPTSAGVLHQLGNVVCEPLP